MSIQTQALVRETARDVAVVAAFGFWAVMLGLMPIIAIHALFG